MDYLIPYDSTVFVRSAIHEVMMTLFEATGLVIIVSFRQGCVRAEDPRKCQPLRGLRLSSGPVHPRPGWLLWSACGSGTSSGALGLPGRPRMFPDRTDLAT